MFPRVYLEVNLSIAKVEVMTPADIRAIYREVNIKNVAT